MKTACMTTMERLATALADVGAPAAMIEKARTGQYDDFKSSSATPISDLVHDALHAGLDDIARRAMDGEFDATATEAEAWAVSHEGRTTIQSLTESHDGTFAVGDTVRVLRNFTKESNLYNRHGIFYPTAGDVLVVAKISPHPCGGQMLHFDQYPRGLSARREDGWNFEIVETRENKSK